MKSLKYILIIGALYAGMTSLAHAALIGPTPFSLTNNSQAGELAAFKTVSGHTDATMCVIQWPDGGQPNPVINSFGTFTFTILPFNSTTGHFEVGVSFTTTPGHVVCGFLTKNGHGNDVFIYTLDPGQSSGAFVLEVPFTGALSHIDVFCCPGGVSTPDGGATVMLLGAGLGALGIVRRYLKS
jgi:hypothetical protein